MLQTWMNRVFRIEEINGDGRCPTYLFRWTLLRVGKLFAIYLHKFVGPDWSLDLHDHPKRFISIGLKGWYNESISGMKAVRDEIARTIGRNDGDPLITWVYEQERGKPKEYAVRVSIATGAK